MEKWRAYRSGSALCSTMHSAFIIKCLSRHVWKSHGGIFWVSHDGDPSPPCALRLPPTGQSYGPRAVTGAAASSGAAVHALRSLTRLLCLTLNDDDVGPLLQPRREEAGSGAAPAAASALAQLQALAAGRQLPAAASEVAAPVGSDGPQAFRKGDAFRVRRSAEWATATAQRLQHLLPMLLPPLAAYPRPAVRVALMQGAIRTSLCVVQFPGWRRNWQQISPFFPLWTSSLLHFPAMFRTLATAMC